MPKRISPSQLRNKLRQAQSKQRQAINDINRTINKYNQAARRYNQNLRQAVNNYNHAARSHNARLRSHQRRIKDELAKLSRKPTTSRYTIYRTSVSTLHESYVRLDQRSQIRSPDPAFDRLVDLSEQEVANSLSVANALFGDEAAEEATDNLGDAALTDELRKISPDLDKRWQGAVFSLNPRNPDAARHFCTSAREIIIQILDLCAPDNEVLPLFPREVTQHGKPTRRAKIKYFLHRKGMTDDALEEFVESDIDNIVELFRIFNDGTHGSAGKFGLRQLAKIKKRVEDGILFLAQIVA